MRSSEQQTPIAVDEPADATSARSATAPTGTEEVNYAADPVLSKFGAQLLVEAAYEALEDQSENMLTLEDVPVLQLSPFPKSS